MLALAVAASLVGSACDETEPARIDGEAFVDWSTDADVAADAGSPDSDDTALDGDGSDGDGASLDSGDTDGDGSDPDGGDAAGVGSDPDGGDNGANTDTDVADAGDATDVPDAPPMPPRVLVTIDELPAAMNGSVPYTVDDGPPQEFHIRVNRADFTLDLLVEPLSGSIDWTTLATTCSVSLALPGGAALPADEPFGIDAFERRSDDHYRLHVTAATAVDADVRCAAEVSGPGGRVDAAVAFETAELPPHLDPFVEVDVWLVTLSRDIVSLAYEANRDGTITVVTTDEPNGAVDWEEAMYAIGLFNADNPETTAIVREMLLERVRTQTRAVFGLTADGTADEESVRIEIHFEGEAAAPLPEDFDGTSFSMISMAGQLTDRGNFGRAAIDWNNQHADDNTGPSRGVSVGTIVAWVVSYPLAALVLEDIFPEIGTPIGSHPDDATFLAPGFDPAGDHTAELRRRYGLFDIALRGLSLATAVTLAHEMGHSLGLVPAGPPPRGLFSGMPGLDITESFIDAAHIDTAGLNIMQTGRSATVEVLSAFSEPPAFNPLNLAYLRRRIVVGEP